MISSNNQTFFKVLNFNFTHTESKFIFLSQFLRTFTSSLQSPTNSPNYDLIISEDKHIKKNPKQYKTHQPRKEQFQDYYC